MTSVNSNDDSVPGMTQGLEVPLLTSMSIRKGNESPVESGTSQRHPMAVLEALGRRHIRSDSRGKLSTSEQVAYNQTAASDKQRLQTDIQLCAASISSIVIMILQNILIWEYGSGTVTLSGKAVVPDDEEPLWLFYLVASGTVIMSVLNVASIVLLAQYYLLLLNDKRIEWAQDLIQAGGEKKGVNRSYRFLSSSLFPKFIAELTIHLVFPFPWMATLQPATYNFLQIGMFLRLYLVFRLLHTSSAPFRKRFHIRQFYEEFRRMNWQVRWQLTLKILFYEHSVLMVTLCTVVTLSLAAFSLFVLERKRVVVDSSTSLPVETEFASLGNCLWFAFVTFTTIGYGDMTPKTTSGRILTCILSVVGQGILAIFGGVVTNRLAPSKQQQLIVSYLETQTGEAGFRAAAATLIQSVWRSTRNVQSKTHSGKSEGTMKQLAKKAGQLPSNIVAGLRQHKRNKVYAAVKRFRSKRCELVEAQLQAGDPVVDEKLDRLVDDLGNVAQVVHELALLLSQGQGGMQRVPSWCRPSPGSPSFTRCPGLYQSPSSRSLLRLRRGGAACSPILGTPALKPKGGFSRSHAASFAETTETTTPKSANHLDAATPDSTSGRSSPEVEMERTKGRKHAMSKVSIVTPNSPLSAVLPPSSHQPHGERTTVMSCLAASAKAANNLHSSGESQDLAIPHRRSIFDSTQATVPIVPRNRRRPPPLEPPSADDLKTSDPASASKTARSSVDTDDEAVQLLIAAQALINTPSPSCSSPRSQVRRYKQDDRVSPEKTACSRRESMASQNTSATTQQNNTSRELRAAPLPLSPRVKRGSASVSSTPALRLNLEPSLLTPQPSPGFRESQVTPLVSSSISPMFQKLHPINPLDPPPVSLGCAATPLTPVQRRQMPFPAPRLPSSSPAHSL